MSLNLQETIAAIISNPINNLAAELTQAIAPINQLRETLRDHLTGNEFITALSAQKSYFPIAAIDGAYVVKNHYVGDQVNVLSVAVQSDLDAANINLTHAIPYSGFRPHSAGNDIFARTVMFTNELKLIPQTANTTHLTLIDGSHLTSATAIFEALSTGNEELSNLILDETDALVDAAAALCTNALVLGAPKSDSSTHLTDYFAEHSINLPSPPLPDKVIATLVLEPGEVLTIPTSAFAWENYNYCKDAANNSNTASFIEAFNRPYQQLRENGISISYIKPFGASTVVKVEHKKTLDPFTTIDALQAIADDCEPAHIQEPITQYIVDVLAKQVSDAAKYQHAEATLELSATVADESTLSILTRSYRTN